MCVTFFSDFIMYNFNACCYCFHTICMSIVLDVCMYMVGCGYVYGSVCVSMVGSV